MTTRTKILNTIIKIDTINSMFLPSLESTKFKKKKKKKWKMKLKIYLS